MQVTNSVRLGYFSSDQINGYGRLSLVSTFMVDCSTALIVWFDRVRQRRQLLALGDRALQDFGMNFAEAEKEGSKPFWRA